MRYLWSLLCVGVLVGCMEGSPKEKLDGAMLLEQKCAKCHNLDMPPKSYEDEIAPSMMAVTFHLKDFIKSTTPSDHESKVVAFITDYVMEPSREKSYCDKASLDSYGVMPSQKGNVTPDELEAIAHMMYQTFDNHKLLKILKERQRLASLTVYERVLEQQRCENCHDINQDKVAPSFKMIASRYTPQDRATLIESIKSGSRGKWQGKTLPMPPFKQLSDQEIEGVVEWILSLKP